MRGCNTNMFVVVLFFLALSSICLSPISAKKHHYKEGDEIPLYLNNIGPYANPTETYEYLSLPFCHEGPIVKKSQKMGEFIEGDRSIVSGYHLPFKTDVSTKALCKINLTKEAIVKFRDAIDKKYYLEMIYDDLSIFTFIGITNYDEDLYANAAEPNRFYLLNHFEFRIEYNEDQVIRINVSATAAHELIENQPGEVDMTYNAIWTPTNFPFEKRNDFYKDPFFMQLEIHWLSIMNSFVLVILLTGFLAIIIMRVLKSDYARYAREEDEEDDQEDYGWKLIHGDVFRFPQHKNIFTAFMGIGAQFLTMVTGILLLAIFGLYYPNNGGNMYVTAIALYAVTAVVGGYVAGRKYKQMNGDKWTWNIVLAATLFAVPFVLVVIYVNSVAIHFKVTAALPLLTIFEVVCIWALVGFPLTVIGGIAGRRLSGPYEAPCRTKTFPREIPPIPWYRTLPFQMMMAGFLPFSAIYIELLYIYSAVWGRTAYALFGILGLVFIILLVVTACITVALTYFQLSMEDHRWWWYSFINGGSTGFFIYGFSIFYYIYRSSMTGTLQGSFYFSYMLIVCYFFFLLLGFVGHTSSAIFVWRIYKNLKFE